MQTYYQPTIDPRMMTITPTISSNPYNAYNTYNLNHDILYQIYNNLLRTINSRPSSKNQQLKSALQDKIKYKLQKLKNIEEQLAKELEDARLKNYLQTTSRGYIDPNKIPDKDLPLVLAKHSNLLGLSNRYHKNHNQLVNTLNTINGTLVNGISPKYHLSMNYTLK